MNDQSLVIRVPGVIPMMIKEGGGEGPWWRLESLKIIYRVVQHIMLSEKVINVKKLGDMNLLIENCARFHVMMIIIVKLLHRLYGIWTSMDLGYFSVVVGSRLLGIGFAVRIIVSINQM